MTQFEFLSVFISIVLAFGVSDILSSWGEQIRFREQVRHYWLHTVWSVLLLLLIIQAWWGLWSLRDRTDWTFADNLLLILPNLLLALLAYVLAPSVSKGQNDIKQYYFSNAPWIFGIGTAYLVSVIFNTNNALGTPFLDPANSVRAIGIMLMVTLATSKNEIFHKVAAALGYVLLAAWIVLTLSAL